jgi:hypothetical protein
MGFSRASTLSLEVSRRILPRYLRIQLPLLCGGAGLRLLIHRIHSLLALQRTVALFRPSLPQFLAISYHGPPALRLLPLNLRRCSCDSQTNLQKDGSCSYNTVSFCFGDPVRHTSKLSARAALLRGSFLPRVHSRALLNPSPVVYPPKTQPPT